VYSITHRAIRQIRVGNTNETKGTAYVVYEDIWDAKNACEHLSGFNILGRYLVVLCVIIEFEPKATRLTEHYLKNRYHNPGRLEQKKDLAKQESELQEMKKQFGVS
jgi:pre-mRNA branch site protein p14